MSSWKYKLMKKLAVLGCGIIWFQTFCSLRNLGGHLVIFLITQYFSSENVRGLLKTRQILAELGWIKGSFYKRFLLLPAGGSWHVDSVLSWTFPHCLSYIVPPFYISIVIFFAPGPFPELPHPSFLSFKIVCLPQS